MNIFAFRQYKGKFNLGNSDDIPPNSAGTLIGAMNEIGLNINFENKLETITFENDGSILETLADGSTIQTVFNSDGSISQIYTHDGDSIEWKTTFNSDGSITIAEVV